MFSVYELSEDMLEQVIVSHDDCWIWTGRINNQGYGQCGNKLAHRMAFTIIVGRISDGMTLDHLCQRTACINPNHLEMVSRGENSRRVFNHVPYRFIDYSPRPPHRELSEIFSPK